MTDRSPPKMTPERWRRVEELVDGALDLPAGERPSWLASACGDDRALLDDVTRLVEAADEPNAILTDRTPSFVELVAQVERDDREGAAAMAGMPARIGAWRVVAPAGEGGMGTVYAVERDDGEYRMRAALKVVRSGLHLDAAFVRRFREERQILARLDHPNVARLLDGGVTNDGRPYYVMEFVDGAPIDRWCDARRLSIEARLALFVKVCDGVAAAHAREIVHRDLKPSNVLVTAQGEPKLLDFGIAKTLAPLRYTAEHALAGIDSSTSVRSTLTRTGERLLTPEYASPEQIRGEAVTPATDVYALGVLLYELLTGQRPYHGRNRSRHEIERAILEEAPTRPSAVATRPAGEPASDANGGTGPSASAESIAAARGLTPNELRRRLRGDLDTIVLAALRKEPERRYDTAAALAADVRRHLEGRAVHARGDSAAYRLRVWAGRHRHTVAAGIVGLATGLVALIVFAVRSADRAVSEAAVASGLAETVTTRSPIAARYYADAWRAHASGRWGTATRLFQAAVNEDSTFAIAAAYGAEAAYRDEDYIAGRYLLYLSVRHAPQASTRERLVVMAHYWNRLRAPELAAYADSLSQLFPSSMDALLWRGRAAMTAGDWSAAAAEFRRVIERDTSMARHLVPCYACAAHLDLVITYLWADSLAEAEREARKVIELQPMSAGAWQILAVAQTFSGRWDDSAFRRRVELDPSDADYGVETIADRRLRQADFAGADALLGGRIETAPPDRRERAMGWLIKSLRMQERWPEALEVARRFRALDTTTSAGALNANAVPEAQVLLESGRPREAAAILDSVSRWPSSPSGARAWHLTHMAGALAAAGDTAALPALIDTVRSLAPGSGYGRDARLHHHIEGLLLVARGRDAEAVEAFRRAIFSWNLGYTRTNLELGRALLRLGRSSEAVAALQPALRGSLEVNNSYVTHTALHRALADAWRAAGNRDSAAAHERWVRTATGSR